MYILYYDLVKCIGWHNLGFEIGCPSLWLVTYQGLPSKIVINRWLEIYYESVIAL